MKDPRSILITGASSGIGAALAVCYAAPGVYLALTGRNASRLTEVADDCRQRGATVDAETIDVADREVMSAFVRSVDQAHALDLVIANAGVDSSGFDGDARYYGVLDVNLNGVINTFLPVLEPMRARRRGQIALVSSLAGFRGMPTTPVYCASKAAVRVLGEGLRGRLSGVGIEVSVITPGFVDSRITEGSKLPMPFKWSAPRAAETIRRRLARNVGRIAFPWPMHFAAWLIAALPTPLTDRLLSLAPRSKY